MIRNIPGSTAIRPTMRLVNPSEAYHIRGDYQNFNEEIQKNKFIGTLDYPEQTFACHNKGCGRVYKNKNSLVQHLKYGCLKKMFKCGYCDCWSSYPFNLAAHSKCKHADSEIKILLLKDNELVEYRYERGMRGPRIK